jgi:hypothetical protein
MSGVNPIAFLASTSTEHLFSMKFNISTCPAIETDIYTASVLCQLDGSFI